MDAPRPPVPDDANADLAALASLWLRGLDTTHDAGCGCGGLFVPALNARLIEEDFLDYLHARYTGEGRAELAGFIAFRRDDPTRGIAPNTFDRWIATLGRSPLSNADIGRLLTDIATFVESMGGGARRGPGVCY
jgi:hypothetical protein